MRFSTFLHIFQIFNRINIRAIIFKTSFASLFKTTLDPFHSVYNADSFNTAVHIKIYYHFNLDPG